MEGSREKSTGLDGLTFTYALKLPAEEWAVWLDRQFETDKQRRLRELAENYREREDWQAAADESLEMAPCFAEVLTQVIPQRAADRERAGAVLANLAASGRIVCEEHGRLVVFPAERGHVAPVLHELEPVILDLLDERAARENPAKETTR